MRRPPPPTETINVPSHDLDRLTAFYRHVFGAVSAPCGRTEGPAPAARLVLPGSSTTITATQDPAPKRPAEVEVVMRCPLAFRRAHRQLVCLAATTAPLRPTARELSFRDPDGQARLVLALARRHPKEGT